MTKILTALFVTLSLAACTANPGKQLTAKERLVIENNVSFGGGAWITPGTTGRFN